MGKRISEVERVTTFFQNADESAATVMVQVIKGIMAVRFVKEKPAKRTRGPNKPKSEPKAGDNGSFVESLRALIQKDFYKEDIEKFSAGKKLEAMSRPELETLRDTLAALPSE